MKIQFTKMSGAGNDFVVIDNRSGVIFDPSAFSVNVCNRRSAIGADGVLLLESSDQADFTMKYYNADGSNGMCGNGGRCIAKFAYDNRIVTQDQFTFEALGHIYSVKRFSETQYELTMKNPYNLTLNQQISFEEKLIKANYLNTGTDHAVLFLEDNEIGSLNSVDVNEIGKTVRYHAVYRPLGTNVNFVSKLDSNSIAIRTYERGVEDETLACGTGSVASALISSLKYGLESPVQVKVLSGETLTIAFDKEGTIFTNVRLHGSAVVTFQGEIEIARIGD